MTETFSFKSMTRVAAAAPPDDDRGAERSDPSLDPVPMPGDDELSEAGECVPLDDGSDAGRRPKNQPLKQLIGSLRRSTRPCIQIYVADYDRDIRKKELRRRALENEERKAARAAKRDAPAHAIEEEGRRRLRLLELALRYQRGDKLLEQLVGRAEELTDFWVASKLAALASPLGRASDRDVGEHFSRRAGKPCNKDQARTRRKLVDQLELRRIWLKVSES